MLIKAQEGVQGGTLAGGSPFSLRLYVCADTLGGFRWLVLPFDPISLVLAQRNGVEPPKKSAFLPWWLHHPRERCCLGGRDVPRPTWGGGWWFTGRSSQLDAVGCDVGASSPWERRVGPYMSRGGTHKRVSLGLHPVSLRKSKEMGWNGQGQRGLLPKKTAHTYKAKDKAALSLCFLRVRRYVGWESLACPAIRPHFFGACPKKRCRAAKEKRLFTLAAPPSA